MAAAGSQRATRWLFLSAEQEKAAAVRDVLLNCVDAEEAWAAMAPSVADAAADVRGQLQAEAAAAGEQPPPASSRQPARSSASPIRAAP